MPMRHPLALFIVGLICIVVSPAWAQVEVDLKPILEAAREKHGLSAMGAILIVDGKIGEPQVVGVIGKGLDVAVPTDARWHMGSCTKSMTAMLAAVMVEQGKLRWETTLSEAFADTDVELHPDLQAVTIEQLLGHRAGIAKDMIHRPIWIKLRNGGLTAIEQRHLITQTYLGEAPVSPPGTKYEYTNVGYVIVGHIIERIEDKPYEALMREYVFEPLGLASAGFGPPVGDAQPRGHKKDKPLPPKHRFADNPEGLAPAGRVHMSLQDWARYAQVHLRAARGESFELLTEASYKQLHTPLEGQNYAMGWICPTRRWAHGQALTHVGSNTMWRCAIWIAPGQNAAILVTTNHGGDDADAGEREVIKAVIETLFPAEDDG